MDGGSEQTRLGVGTAVKGTWVLAANLQRPYLSNGEALGETGGWKNVFVCSFVFSTQDQPRTPKAGLKCIFQYTWPYPPTAGGVTGAAVLAHRRISLTPQSALRWNLEWQHTWVL